MNDQRDPNEPLEESTTDHSNAEAASKRVIPRPSEVHPLNAVTGTPPPVDVLDELGETELPFGLDGERPSTEPNARSSAPPGRVSLVPPSRLTTTLHAGTSSGLASRASRHPSAPSPRQVNTPESLPPELEVSRPSAPDDSEQPLGSASERTRAPSQSPRPSLTRTLVGAPSLKPSAAPSVAVSPSGSPAAPGVLGPSLRPSALGRSNTSLPPASLKAKGLRPTSLPPILDKVALINEEPVTCEATETLASNQLREVILRRAQSALAHANTLTEPNQKARYYVLTSELYAMLGLPQTARLLAERAAKLGNHLGHRQVRQLAHTTGDDKAASTSFVSEITSAPNTEVRRHVATAATHFERWVRKDALSATRNSEHLQRLVPTDPGPQLLKLAQKLGQSNNPPSNFTWHPDAHQKLISANVSLQKLRGDAQRIGDDCKDPVATFLEVRAALERRDRVAAAKGLLNLRHQPGYERAVVWLAALLLSPVAATRDKAIELLQQLRAEQDTKTLRRSLAERAVEAANKELFDEVIRSDEQYAESDKAFTVADHLAFIALGLKPAVLEPWASAANDESLAPLFRAVAHANNAAQLLESSDGARSNTAESAPVAARTGPDVVVDRLRELEDAYNTGDTDTIARVLLALEGLGSAPDLSFVAATTTATKGFTPEAKRWLTIALESPVCGEAALYALLVHSPRLEAPPFLELVASTTTSPEHKALLLAHAALITTDREEQIRLSSEAFAACPTHPLVEAVTHRYVAATTAAFAQQAGNLTAGEPPSSRPRLANQLVGISNAQSVSARSAFERALALVRQALRSPLGNSRDTLLAHARELLPEDVTLLDLVEGTNGQAPAARARAREQLLAHTNGSASKATLRTEAALLYELGGQFSDAARVSEPLVTEDDTWRWCFERNAPGTEFSSSLRKRVLERAASAAHQAERASGWIHAARLASDAGDWAGEQSAIDNALRLDPNHLEGLLAAETLAFKEGEPERIAEVETLLAEAFPAPDNLPHARIAVRFLQTRGGSSAGYTLLLECAESGVPSLDVARRLVYVAPRMGDDELAYAMVQHLVPTASNQHDCAILWLHAANLALKLGRANQAITHAEQSLEVCPDYVPALQLRAQLLANRDLHAEAAEAFERLGANAQSPSLGGLAFKRAAEHLLKETPSPTLVPAGDMSSEGLLVTPNAGVDLPRLRVNLERALALLPEDPWLFECLVQTYTIEKLQQPLSELFASRLANAPASERATLSLRLARAFQAIDQDERALQVVNEVLSTTPDDERALVLLAQLAKTDAEREKTLLQLVRVSSSSAQQAAAYKQLGNFYRTSAPAALRAVKSFQEVLKRDPTDSEALRALVELQIGNQDYAAAELSIASYAERSQTPVAQHLVAVLRAVVAGARDPEEGARLLEELLRIRPVDEVALRELAGLYVRTGQADKLSMLVKRTRDFAMHQIPVGDQLLESLKCVAELAQVTGESSELLLVNATFNLYHGVNTGLDARGSRALAKTLDDVLAPPPLLASVRNFLAQTADRWHPAVTPSEDAKITDKRIRAAFEMKARAASVPVPELFTSEKDPYSCVVLHNPPRVILGATWVREAPQAVLDFLAWRCLKVLQAGIGPFVHLTNREALLHIDVLLRRFVDTQDVLVPAEEQLDSHELLRAERDPVAQGASLEFLATQVLEQLVQSELELGDALRLWVNRCALLATGEPRTGLQYVAISNGELHTTTTGDAIAFAARNPEARNLLRSMLDDGVAVAHRTIH